MTENASAVVAMVKDRLMNSDRAPFMVEANGGLAPEARRPGEPETGPPILLVYS